MKKFLLLAGDHYYPRGGTDNWIGCFATREEAEAQVFVAKEPFYGIMIKMVNGKPVDWYEIVDLEEWMNK
jgi:hypothetical protein